MTVEDLRLFGRFVLKLAAHAMNPTDHPQIVKDAIDLAHDSRRLRKLYVDDLNEPASPGRAKLEAKLEAHASEIATLYRATAAFNDDPRGPAVQLLFADEPGREFTVPT